MNWSVDFHPSFAEEFKALSEEVQDLLYAEVEVLIEFGPQLGRPHVDTLNHSKHSNMKELRFYAGGGRVANGICI